jgi:hypothetical protein
MFGLFKQPSFISHLKHTIFMKSGKILLVIFIVAASAIGLATFQEFNLVENHQVTLDDFSSNFKTVKISLSDGIGSKLSGFK